MNNKVIFGLGGFLLGLVTGGAIAYKYMDSRFDRVLSEEIASVKEYAKKQIKKAEESLVYEDDQINTETGEFHTSTVYFADGEGVDSKVVLQKEPDILNMPERPSRQDRMKAPYIISSSEFTDEMEHFDKLALTYYEGDEIFADDNDDIIDDIRNLVGDAYEYFGCDPEDPDIVHVRNYKLASDFELIRVHGRYADLVGFHD